MKTKIINLVSDFSASPTGRYTSDVYPDSGQRFRDEVLTPALKEFDQVTVVLDGYNRYGRSFLDEAFGGLIRESKFTKSDLDKKLICQHRLVPSIIALINERIEQAENIGRCSASPDSCASGVDAFAEEFDDLSHLDVGSIDTEAYQQQENDGCEGGACKI